MDIELNEQLVETRKQLMEARATIRDLRDRKASDRRVTIADVQKRNEALAEEVGRLKAEAKRDEGVHLDLVRKFNDLADAVSDIGNGIREAERRCAESTYDALRGDEDARVKASYYAGWRDGLKKTVYALKGGEA